VTDESLVVSYLTSSMARDLTITHNALHLTGRRVVPFDRQLNYDESNCLLHISTEQLGIYPLWGSTLCVCVCVCVC